MRWQGLGCARSCWVIVDKSDKVVGTYSPQYLTGKYIYANIGDSQPVADVAFVFLFALPGKLTISAYPSVKRCSGKWGEEELNNFLS